MAFIAQPMTVDFLKSIPLDLKKSGIFETFIFFDIIHSGECISIKKDVKIPTQGTIFPLKTFQSCIS